MGGWTGCDVTCLCYVTVWRIVSGYRVESPKARFIIVVHVSPVLPVINEYIQSLGPR